MHSQQSGVQHCYYGMAGEHCTCALRVSHVLGTTPYGRNCCARVAQLASVRAGQESVRIHLLGLCLCQRHIAVEKGQ